MAPTSFTHINGSSSTLPSMNGNGAGPSNGHLSMYSSAPSSPPPLPVAGSYMHKDDLSPATHAQTIVQHLYHAGFRSGNYSDITLQVPWRQYALHALIISRSPYLAHMMSTSPSSKTIVIPLEQEPHVAPEGFDIALSYLYSPAAVEAVNPHNARHVLAAACLLGGMDELAGYAYSVCLQSLSVQTMNEWLDFLETIPASSEDGTSHDAASVFGPYAKRLREDVFSFVVVSLPTSLGVFTGSENPDGDNPGYETLLHIYARLAFEFFKRALESPRFPLQKDRDRFNFAKSVISLRKQKGFSRDAEETVVLAFDGQSESGCPIHITRKMKRKALWKVTK